MQRLFFTLIFILTVTFVAAQTLYKHDVGKQFPIRSFVTIDGEKIDSTYLKNKIVVYNFYYDACTACRIEMNSLNILYDKYNNNETVFIAITPDDVATAKETRKKFGLKYKIVSLPGNEISALTNKTNYPTNIVIDKLGKIAVKESGTVYPEKYTIMHVMDTFGSVIDKLKSE